MEYTKPSNTTSIIIYHGNLTRTRTRAGMQSRRASARSLARKAALAGAPLATTHDCSDDNECATIYTWSPE